MKMKSGARQQGFTLIELMVALLLGLLVIAAAGSIFLSNRRVYGNTEAINRIQENQRAAFEILARDIREAGGNPCTRFSDHPVSLRSAASGSAYWARFNGGIHGESGGTDAITVYRANDMQRQIVQHKAPEEPLVLNSAAGLVTGQDLIACNNDAAIVFSVTAISGNQVSHDVSANCGKGMTREPDASKCTEPLAGPAYCFWGDPTVPPSALEASKCQPGVGRSPAFVVQPAAVRWSVESNARGGNSLYRTSPGGKDEIAEGVTGLSITYKVGDATRYVDAGTVDAGNAWALVTAVHLAMTFEAVQGSMARADVEDIEGATLTRSVEDVIVLRNHQGNIL